MPDQRRLKLAGYPGGSDIIGNWVNQQFQLDAFGEALLLFADAASLDRLDTDGWSAAETAAEAIARRWTEPDAGIWEIDNQPWTHSRLTAAAGLRAIASARPAPGRAADWLSLADAIVADTAATPLRPLVIGSAPPTIRDLTARCSCRACAAPYPRKTRVPSPRSPPTPETSHGMATPTGSVRTTGHSATLKAPSCSADSSWRSPRISKATRLSAHRWYERTRAACGPPQLFSEEYDQTQHQMRGNLPQAFVHALMIEASVRLASR